MAAARAKAANIGSVQWVQKEREQAGEFVEQELEEFGYSVRNEMEWLNEHMAEIFSTNSMCVFSSKRLARTSANAFSEISPMCSKHPGNYEARRLALRANEMHWSSASH